MTAQPPARRNTAATVASAPVGSAERFEALGSTGRSSREWRLERSHPPWGSQRGWIGISRHLVNRAQFASPRGIRRRRDHRV